ncbi:MAG: efflux RND transporter periplasmic adaptor subunit [Pirellulaceae bacterium]
MSDDKMSNDPTNTPVAKPPAENGVGPESSVASAARPERMPPRWWIKLLVPPVLILAAGGLLIFGLGAAQRLGWVSAGGGSSGREHASVSEEHVRYICPMMCTPPQSEPGRCPVCAMELVPASSSTGDTDGLSIQVDPVARRVANIRTVAVQAVPLVRNIRAIGELSYDEGTLKTIAAYVDGRLDRLYADYTGVVVKKGDHLAWLYSPQLYSGQVELLLAKRAREGRRSTMPSGAATASYSGSDLYQSARERLVEWGMTASQIEQLEKAGEANSRMHLSAPISGTVIEKLAVEGQYVKTGQPIYRLADLSSVWLMLELFPEDVAMIRYGQQVEAEVQSLPGRKFTGRVAFIDPTVEPKTRTVGVRVVIPNSDGLLRVGDYAKATIAVQLGGSGDQLAKVYDSELANKWISPRHPQVVESSPGNCRLCGVELVPAATLGFTGESAQGGRALTVPRDAVLMVGDHGILYVETEPGRFEIRHVVLGPSSGDQIAILEGVKEGERVARSGNFLIDSQMQLVGNPSLIDPTKALPRATLEDDDTSAKVLMALAELPAEDRALAEEQQICPVTKLRLGSMGAPLKVALNGRSVFICCEGCRGRLLEKPAEYLANLAASVSSGDSREALPHADLPPIGVPQRAEPQSELPPIDSFAARGSEAEAIHEALAKLSPSDRGLAERQKICPVADMPLGSMGTPIRVNVSGRAVFICCEGCREDLLAEPAKHLAKLAQEVPR